MEFKMCLNKFQPTSLISEDAEYELLKMGVDILLTNTVIYVRLIVFIIYTTTMILIIRIKVLLSCILVQIYSDVMKFVRVKMYIVFIHNQIGTNLWKRLSLNFGLVVC